MSTGLYIVHYLSVVVMLLSLTGIVYSIITFNVFLFLLCIVITPLAFFSIVASIYGGPR